MWGASARSGITGRGRRRPVDPGGESVSLEFTASEDLAEYFCEYHPESMRGEMGVVAAE